MQSHCLVFRDAPTLQEGIKKIDEVWKEMKNEIKVIIIIFVQVYNNIILTKCKVSLYYTKQ